MKNLLLQLGPSGEFTWRKSENESLDLEISDSISVQLQSPTVITYRLEGDELNLEFSKPYPIGKFKRIAKHVPYLTVHALEKVIIGLDWSPDGYVKVAS